MAKTIYDKAEFMAKTGIAEDRLNALLEKQMFLPAGKVDGSTPYFDESSVQTLEPILKLFEIGYSLEDIVRIRQKVGLPGKGAVKTQPGQLPLLTVGELATRIGSNPRTIKHWEEKGIIEPDSYSPGGFRLYGEVYVQLCLLIMDLQLFGYSLDEIKVVADLFRDFVALKDDTGVFSPEKTAEKLALMKEQIAALHAKMDQFEQGIKRWRTLLRQRQKEIEAIAQGIEKDTRKAARKAPVPAEAK
ncbi:MAG: MerR family transcriptional regulator [Deltaproteobacteria bacterium]|nr:MerR family transcriptional regulator [Deltaproteobacteria bacterium]